MLGNLLILVPSSAAQAVRSNTPTATTREQVLLESSVARVLLSVVASAAECSCARGRLATTHENTLYPPRTHQVPGSFVFSISVRFIKFDRIFVPRIALPAILVELIMLEQYAAVKQPQQDAYECCSRRVLLECRWVLLLLLGVRVPVTAWPRRARVCLSFSLRLSNRVIVALCRFFAVQ